LHCGVGVHVLAFGLLYWYGTVQLSHVQCGNVVSQTFKVDHDTFFTLHCTVDKVSLHKLTIRHK